MRKNEKNDQLLTRKEVAELLRITQHRLRKLMKAGLPYIQISKGEIRFHRQAIEQWLAERQRSQE